MTSEIKHRTLAAIVVDRLRQEILNGVFPSGSALRQDALAATYGVSRIPVREALFQLEAEGLLQIVPHKGAIVTTLSQDEVKDVFDLRVMLEPRLFRDSIPALTAQDFEQLENIQEQFAEAIRAKDLVHWGTLNAALHSALYARARLPQTATIVAGLLQKSDRYTRLQLSTPTALNRALQEHGDLINLCKQAQVEPACELLRAHIEAVRDDLLNLLGGIPSKPG